MVRDHQKLSLVHPNDEVPTHRIDEPDRAGHAQSGGVTRTALTGAKAGRLAAGFGAGFGLAADFAGILALALALVAAFAGMVALAARGAPGGR